jgi:hypothetical protein
VRDGARGQGRGRGLRQMSAEASLSSLCLLYVCVGARRSRHESTASHSRQASRRARPCLPACLLVPCNPWPPVSLLRARAGGTDGARPGRRQLWPRRRLLWLVSVREEPDLGSPRRPALALGCGWVESTRNRVGSVGSCLPAAFCCVSSQSSDYSSSGRPNTY